MKKLFLLLFIPILLFANIAKGENILLTASWYSITSLKRDGQWKITKGVMANGKNFNDNNLTCATRLYVLGTYLRITKVDGNKTIIVKVTDRIGKKFAKTRIDLSKRAFSKLLSKSETLDKGLLKVKVEIVK